MSIVGVDERTCEGDLGGGVPANRTCVRYETATTTTAAVPVTITGAPVVPRDVSFVRNRTVVVPADRFRRRSEMDGNSARIVQICRHCVRREVHCLRTGVSVVHFGAAAGSTAGAHWRACYMCFVLSVPFGLLSLVASRRRSVSAKTKQHTA